MVNNIKETVLEVRNLNISFNTYSGEVNAIRGVSFDLFKGETLAIVGESGSGKSVTTKAIMGMLSGNSNINDGTIKFKYTNKHNQESERSILTLTEKQLQRHIRGKRIGIIFQDPMTSLDPTMKIGKQIMEGILEHLDVTKQEAKVRAIELLDKVGIVNSKSMMNVYPHQLSGGMRQRVVIAIALSCEPTLLICDEPTTALDVTIQAQILELIKKLQEDTGVSIIFITHDLGVVANVADRVAVMYAGKIVEVGTVDEIFYEPAHPYTNGLLKSMPDLETGDSLYAIPGTPPNLLYPIKGDSFAPRNKGALKIDYILDPPLFKISSTHIAATWTLHPYYNKNNDIDEIEVFSRRLNKFIKYSNPENIIVEEKQKQLGIEV